MSKSARPAKDFESCETVSIAESAQCSLVRFPAQHVTCLPRPRLGDWSERDERNDRWVGITTWAECLAVERSGSCRDTRRVAPACHRSLLLAVTFNGGGLRVGRSQTKADCRATRHHFIRRSTTAKNSLISLRVVTPRASFAGRAKSESSAASPAFQAPDRPKKFTPVK